MQEPKTLLITGANRGLGLEFVSQFSQKNYQVYCCCRDMKTCDQLLTIARRYPYVKVYQVDVTNEDQLSGLADELKNKPIDILLNNAGIYGPAGENIGAEPIDKEGMINTFLTNALAPLKISEAFIPNLCMGKDRKVVSVSSKMGSISCNTSGGSPAYRSSKAALNAIMRTMAVDLQDLGLKVLLLHPGWVKTDMGTDNAPLSTEESISGMIKVIENYTGENLDEMFMDYTGEKIPW